MYYLQQYLNDFFSFFYFVCIRNENSLLFYVLNILFFFSSFLLFTEIFTFTLMLEKLFYGKAKKLMKK